MKAVFLDRNTFSPTIDLPAPAGVTDWQVFDATANDTATVVARLQGAQIAITNKVLMTREILAQLPELRLIQITATGVNNVDAAACEEHGVKLYNVAGYSTTTVPEHTFAMMLAAMRGHERLTERVGALLDTAGADDLRHVSPGTAALVEDLAPGRGLGVRRREVG